MATEKVFIQIGTNNGDDEFNRIVKFISPTKVILIEPNRALNGEIEENYKSVENVLIENIAIIAEEAGIVKLIYPKEWDNNAEIKPLAHQGFTLIPSVYGGHKEFTELFVPSVTFNNLCKKHNIKDITFLQIDTEGYDCEILRSIDFNNINIKIIKYEKWGDSYKEMNKFLEEMGYITSELLNDILAVKV